MAIALTFTYSTSIRKGDLSAISMSQKGSDFPQPSNLFKQVKVCNFEPKEKLACGMTQYS